MKGYFLRIKEKKLSIFMQVMGVGESRGVLLKALEKRRAFIFLFSFSLSESLNSYGPFCFPRYFIMFIQVHIPCNNFFLFYLRRYHTSHSESLDVTERMDVAMSARSVTLDTLVVGLAAVHGDSAEL